MTDKDSLSVKERARNFRWTILISVALMFIGVVSFLWQDILLEIKILDELLQRLEPPPPSPLNFNFESVENEQLVVETIKVGIGGNYPIIIIGVFLFSAGLTILLSRTMRIDLKASGVLKFGVFSLPVQMSGVVALFCFILVVFTVSLAYLEFRGKLLNNTFYIPLYTEDTGRKIQEKLDAQNMKIAALTSEAIILSKLISDIATKNRIPVEFQLICNVTGSQKTKTLQFLWKPDRSLAYNWFGTLATTDIKVRNEEYEDSIDIQVSDGNSTSLAFSLSQNIDFVVYADIDQDTGHLKIQFKPNIDPPLDSDNPTIDTPPDNIHDYCRTEINSRQTALDQPSNLVDDGLEPTPSIQTGDGSN